jgi:hypothetical protein
MDVYTSILAGASEIKEVVNMSHAFSGFLDSFLLAGALAVLAAIVFGLRQALTLAKWPDRERKQAIWPIMALLALWFVAALFLSTSGFFRATPSGAPTIQYGLLIPILVGVGLFWIWPQLQRTVDAVPQEWLVGLQFYRVEGLIFLVLYAQGRAPGAFALPAGFGDVAVGLLAPLVGIAYARRYRDAAGLVRAWNLLGLADLAVALTTGFLTAPSRLQMLAFDRPNTLIGAFPLVLIPVYLVPLSILLHFASLHKLRQAHATRQIQSPLLAAGRS